MAQPIDPRARRGAYPVRATHRITQMPPGYRFPPAREPLTWGELATVLIVGAGYLALLLFIAWHAGDILRAFGL